ASRNTREWSIRSSSGQRCDAATSVPASSPAAAVVPCQSLRKEISEANTTRKNAFHRTHTHNTQERFSPDAYEDEAHTRITRQQLDGDVADAVRWQLRQEKTKPQLDAFAKWLAEQASRVLPKSPIGQAIAYTRRHWTALMRFTEHGFLNIDNN